MIKIHLGKFQKILANIRFNTLFFLSPSPGYSVSMFLTPENLYDFLRFVKTLSQARLRNFGIDPIGIKG